MYPELVQRAVVIGCGAAQSAWQIGIGETQRQAIYRDPAWRCGYYGDDAPPTDGLCVARQSAMVSFYPLYYLYLYIYLSLSLARLLALSIYLSINQSIYLSVCL